ncbi:polymorphic toxin-type HINT domain-containing protein [Kitasatospora sp. NPDC096147]|uniref:polymorphic toxin-type HINT domain-containing protein n=1 Tax=Kitasatospora sp. NPDC096147 TaxID=3364093 RepID=UPI00380EE4C1
MRITEKRLTVRWQAAIGVVAGSLLPGLLAIPAAADTPASGPLPDRVKAVAAWKAGGPTVRRAAEIALAGSDADVTAFVDSGRAAADDQDLRARIEELIAVAGPGVRGRAAAVLAGTPAERQAFIHGGGRGQYEHDQRARLMQIMAAGGPAVQDSANKAMAGTLEAVETFLDSGQFSAREHDDRAKLMQLLDAGGPQVKNAANAAMAGNGEDVRDFLRYGYQTASAHDQETASIAQLADVTRNAAGQAGEQAAAAKDGADQALAASALAKQSSERAVEETRLARGEAGKASNAAGRAADAATRAAVSAQGASSAARKANEAARQAAVAAANAASTATRADKMAGIARTTAADAATNKDKAAPASKAASDARDAAKNARSAGESAAWAWRTLGQAIIAVQTADLASANADAASNASDAAANLAGVSDEQAQRARTSASRAKASAAEARRAAAATLKIANEAASAVADAERAVKAAADHADAAAVAADYAAAHAGDANLAKGIAETASSEAAKAATAAAGAAAQAHKIADIARASDQERLDAQTAEQFAEAQQAYRDEELRKRKALWQAGQANTLAAETEQLITAATTPGVAQDVAVAKGRQAAVRLLEAGGPYTQAAAESALEGDGSDVLAFLSTDLAIARERDDRATVYAIAEGSTKLEQRLAAETAAVGTAAQVRDFVATGAYPGQEHDDRALLMQIMAAGGPGVQDAANTAMGGNHAAVRAFLTTGQYSAREHDQRALITQALAAEGPEVKAAAQSALAGPGSKLVAFLDVGLPQARQRDAFTAAHVATINSYLAAIDGSVELARQYAAQAAQSYAIARQAAAEADGHAARARAAADEATKWVAKAQQSATQAQASADQAFGYAKQARTSAANATAAAGRASVSASAASVSAANAKASAADAKKSADQAKQAAAAANKSKAEAQQAARQAGEEFYKRKKAEEAEGKTQMETAYVDENGRINFVVAIPEGEIQNPKVTEHNKCNTLVSLTALDVVFSSKWNIDWANDKITCDMKVTVEGEVKVRYVLKTCPDPNLSITQCQGRYSLADTAQLETRTEKVKPFDTVIKVDWKAPADLIIDGITEDFVQCSKDFDFNAHCAWAASNFIPFGTLLKGVKGIAAFHTALEIGGDLTMAKAALKVSLEGIGDATRLRLTAAADAITNFRGLLTAGGVGSETALNNLRNIPDIRPSTIDQLKIEAELAEDARTACKWNSFPAGTLVVLADGTRRPIEQLEPGDSVRATDPATGATEPATVTDTFTHGTDHLIDVSTDSGTVSTTAGHRLYVDGDGWKLASELRTGDRLRSSDGTVRNVTGLNDRVGLALPVYDLTVGGLHTFFVATASDARGDLLVHNCQDIVADEGFDQAHTLDQHVNISGLKLETKVEKDGVVGVWASQDMAARAVAEAFTQWESVPANRAYLARFAQRKTSETIRTIQWELRDPQFASLGKVYTKNPLYGTTPGEPFLKERQAGNVVSITIKYAKNHRPSKFVIYTSYPV